MRKRSAHSSALRELGVVLLLVLSLSQNVFAREYRPYQVVSNGKNLGERWIIVTVNDDVYARKTDLKRTGIREDLGGSVSIDGESYVALRTIHCLNFELDYRNRRIYLFIPPFLLGAAATGQSFGETAQKKTELKKPGLAVEKSSGDHSFPQVPAADGEFNEVALKFVLNGVHIGDIFAFMKNDGDVFVNEADLRKARLQPLPGTAIEKEGARYLSLKSLKGVTFEVDSRDASLMMTASPALFVKTTVDASYHLPSASLEYTKDNSLFLNYNLRGETLRSLFETTTELGVRIGDYLAVTDYNYIKSDRMNRAVRLMTYVLLDNYKDLTTLTFGDRSYSTGIGGSQGILGGIAYSKNFNLRPYYIKYPSLSAQASVSLPSDVSVYLNNNLVRKDRLLPGMYDYMNLPATVGLGNARIVIEDPFGRKIEISDPYYFTDGLLKRGIHEFAYNAGFVRENFGQKSNDYGKGAVTALHNYGLTDKIKVGYSLEAESGMSQLGAGLTFSPLEFGVVDAKALFSTGRGGSGAGGFLGYSYKTKLATFSGSYEGYSRDYGNLSLRPSDDKPKHSVNAGLGFSFTYATSLSLLFSDSESHGGQKTTRYYMTVSRPVTRNSSMYLSAGRTKENDVNKNEIFVGFNMFFDNQVYTNISYTGGQGRDTATASLRKDLPTGTGYGFSVDVTETDKRTSYDATARYQNDYGIFAAGYNRDIGGNDNFIGSVAGGIGYIGGKLFLSRPVLNSYAKVDLGSPIDGVRVYYYGAEAARTDSKGSAIIPNLLPNQENRITIENKDIPIEYSVGSLSRNVAPPYKGGGVVRFNIGKMQGFSGLLYILESGKKTPIEYAIIEIKTNGTKKDTMIGKGGEFYLENLPPGSYKANVFHEKGECGFLMTVPESGEVLVDLGEYACVPDK